MQVIRRVGMVVVSIAIVMQSGCLLMGAAAVGGGAFGLAVANGKATRTFDASVEATAVATQSALRDLGLPVEKPRIGESYGEIDSTLPTGGLILIDLGDEPRLVPADPPRTKVGIHVKVFGDKKFSERLLDQISYRLHNPATEPPPSASPPAPLPSQTEEPGRASAAAPGKP